jgi:endonuclease/exonuclease/phosphatase family metal-dependent hydrolase
MLDMPNESQFGITVFSRLPIKEHGERMYVRINNDGIPESRSDNPTFSNTHNRMVLWCNVEKDGITYRIATTHFTWTPDGSPSDAQRRDLSAMLDKLKNFGEFVLCGDFNAPRGGEIFSAIAAKYKDNIPPKYTTSIDGNLHRAGHIPLMVDGIFSTPAYRISNVVLHNGVSDHCAITADVENVVHHPLK